MLLRRRATMLVALAGILIASAGLAIGVRQSLIDGDRELNPWLYCTTYPCQPLALFPLPTPPALTTDSSLAAACDDSGPGAGDGIPLWHTDWDPLTQEGMCVTRDEAERLGANVR